MADLNRLKVVLVEKKITSKWLAEQMGKDPATISKWCTNSSQPSIETLSEIARILNADIRELLVPTLKKINCMKVPRQFNNITERLVDDLKASLTSQSRLSIAAASFSIYAYEALKKELEAVKELRFIFTSPTFSTDKTVKQKREFYIPKLNRERKLYGSEFEIRLRNQLTQRAIARECAD